MKSGLWIGLSALVCQILAEVRVPSVQDFDAQKFAGKWYLISMVKEKLEFEDIVNVGITATPLGTHDVLLSIVIWKDEACYLETIQLLQTQQPGVFRITVPKDRKDIDTIVHMVQVDYDSYLILHFTTANNRILHLYTRKKKKIRQHSKTFRKVARSLKFDLNKMTYETRNIPCPPGFAKNENGNLYPPS